MAVGWTPGLSCFGVLGGPALVPCSGHTKKPYIGDTLSGDHVALCVRGLSKENTQKLGHGRCWHTSLVMRMLQCFLPGLCPPKELYNWDSMLLARAPCS